MKLWRSGRSTAGRHVAVLAVVALIAACGSNSDDASGESSETSSPTEATTTADATNSTTTTSLPDSSPPTTNSSAPSNDADERPDPPWLRPLHATRSGPEQHLVGSLEAELGAAGVLPEARLTTRAMGPEVSFESDGSYRLLLEEPGAIGLIDLDESRFLHWSSLSIFRPSGVIAPKRAGDPVTTDEQQRAGRPVPEDLVEYFETVPAVVVSDVVDTEIGGLPARRFAVDVDPEAGATFAATLGPNAVNTILLPTSVVQLWGHRSAVAWEIELPDVDLVALAVANDDEAETWIDRADEVLSTLEIGDPAPPPVEAGELWSAFTQIGPGEHRIASLDLRLTVASDTPLWAVQEYGRLSVAPAVSTAPWNLEVAQVVVALPTHHVDGEPIVDASELRSVIEAGEVSVLGEGVETMLGVDAPYIDIAGDGGHLYWTWEPSELLLQQSDFELVEPMPIAPAERVWFVDLAGELVVVSAKGATPEERNEMITLARELFADADLLEAPAAP